ncbi:MAG: SPASM domain-containing protein [Candidatus Sabulitectum sp.]|nr:SPASM domain-containing protein [Candidatus Sabulitectum sp.]
MKTSRYNWIVKSKEDYIVYNGFTGAISRVDANNIGYITEIFNSDRASINTLNSDSAINQALIDNGYIIDDDIDELFILEQIFQARRYANLLDHITVIPTYDCNFCCDYCFESNRSKTNSGVRISNAVIDKIISIASSTRGSEFHITFFGGEPLLALDECLRISDNVKTRIEARNALYDAFIVTNGYLLTDNTARKLRNVGISHAQVTIDGDKNTHDMQRRLRNATGDSANTFDRILANVIASKDIIDIRIRITLDRGNEPQIDQLTSILDENAISYYLAPVKWYPTDSRGDTSANRALCGSINPEAAFKNDILFARAAGCAASEFFNTFVCPDGSLLRCWEEVGKDISYGNILNDSFPDITKSRAWLEWNPYAENSECRLCKMLPTCGGGCPLDSITQNSSPCIYTPETYAEYIRVNYKLKQDMRTD